MGRGGLAVALVVVVVVGVVVSCVDCLLSHDHAIVGFRLGLDGLKITMID